jgi:hypothetical protein
MNGAADAAPMAGPYAPRGERPVASLRLVPRDRTRDRPAEPFVPDPARRVSCSPPSARSAPGDGLRRRGRRGAGAVRLAIGGGESGARAALRPIVQPMVRIDERSNAVAATAGPSSSPRARKQFYDADTLLRLHAATRIEGVARRIRSGELRPLGLTPAMTEAGAMAAALAALLAATR